MTKKKADKSAGANNKEHKPPQDGVLRIYPPTGGEHEQRLRDTTVAYARGDFGSARRLSAEVMAGSHTEEEESFAAEILRRTANDPVALIVGLSCFALFWLIIYLTIWR